MDEQGAFYKPVRGLSRGLAILRALNSAPGGWASINELARATGIHRTTVRRLLETLHNEGLVRRSPSDDSYRLTLEVRALAEGFSDEEWVSQVASPLLGEMMRRVIWPSDLTTLDGDAMVIRETTHRYSPLSFHRSMVRVRMPLATTASGRAYLAFAPPDERARLLDKITPTLPMPRAVLEAQLERVRAQGHATNLGEWAAEPSILALAVPILRGERALACLNVVMLKKAVTLAQAEAQCLGPLKETAMRIAAALASAAPVPQKKA